MRAAKEIWREKVEMFFAPAFCTEKAVRWMSSGGKKREDPEIQFYQQCCSSSKSKKEPAEIEKAGANSRTQNLFCFSFFPFDDDRSIFGLIISPFLFPSPIFAPSFIVTTHFVREISLERGISMSNSMYKCRIPKHALLLQMLRNVWKMKFRCESSSRWQSVCRWPPSLARRRRRIADKELSKHEEGKLSTFWSLSKNFPLSLSAGKIQLWQRQQGGGGGNWKIDDWLWLSIFQGAKEVGLRWGKKVLSAKEHQQCPP